MGTEPIILILGAIVAAIVLLALLGLYVGWKAGRWVGVAIWCALMASMGWWYGARMQKVQDIAAARQARFRQAWAAVGDRCIREAGEFPGTPIPTPANIYVRIDSRFGDPVASGAVGPLGEITVPARSDAGIHYVPAFPEPRPADSAFVDIALILDPVPDAPEWPTRGIAVRITASDSSVVATRIDFKREFDWCLGGMPNVAIERFVQNWLGQRISLSDRDRTPVLVPAAYPMGTATPLVSGRFVEESGANSYRLALASALVAHRCVSSTLMEHMDCGGRPGSNVIDMAQVVAFSTRPAGLLLVSRNGAGSPLYSFDVVELSTDGTIERSWRVRFPAVEVGQFDNGAIFSARNMSVDDAGMRIDVLIGRLSPSEGTPPDTKGIFGHAITVTSQLPGLV